LISIEVDKYIEDYLGLSGIFFFNQPHEASPHNLQATSHYAYPGRDDQAELTCVF